MYQLKYGRIPLPELYLVEDEAEAIKCKEMGIPYIIRPEGFTDEDIVKTVFYGMLTKKFPDINWNKVFFSDKYQQKYEELIVNVPGHTAEEFTEVTGSRDETETDPIVDSAEDTREFNCGFDGDDVAERPLSQYINETKLAAHVKIEELQALKLLPVFLSNIADSIRVNLYNNTWTEGYNKKLKVPIGNFNASSEKPNLIILDISGSIPRGVSSTMLTLISTLKLQTNAELIITGSKSFYYGRNEKLPSPKWIRNHCGYANESYEFTQILKNHILGREWGNIICFGDEDTPWIKQSDLEQGVTKVDKIWAFHTRFKKIPGYIKWYSRLDEHPNVEYNTQWCRCMKW